MLLSKVLADLLEKNTLKDFIVSTHRLPIPSLSGDASNNIIDIMCISAAAAVAV